MHLLYAITIVSCAAVPASCADCFYSFAETQPAQPLRPAHAQTWSQLEAGCAAAYPGCTLLQHVGDLSDGEKGACRQKVVPFGVYEVLVEEVEKRPLYWDEGQQRWFEELFWMYWSGGGDVVSSEDRADQIRFYHGETPGVAAIDLFTGQWGMVSSTQTFECAICQKPRRKSIYFEGPVPVADVKPLSVNASRTVFEITLENKHRTAIANHTLLENNLFLLFDIPNITLQYFHTSFDILDRVQLLFYLISESSSALDVITERSVEVVHQSLAGDFEVIQVRMVSPCPVEDLPDGYQAVSRTTPFDTDHPDQRIKFAGDGQVLVNPDTEQMSTRQCQWDTATSSLAWTPLTYWRVIWQYCTGSHEHDEERDGISAVGPIVIRRLERQLETLTKSPVNCTGLEGIADVVKLIILKSNGLPEKNLDKPYSVLKSYSQNTEKEVCILDRDRFNLLVTTLKPDQPVLGMVVKAVPPSTDPPPTTEITFAPVVELTTTQSQNFFYVGGNFSSSFETPTDFVDVTMGPYSLTTETPSSTTVTESSTVTLRRKTFTEREFVTCEPLRDTFNTSDASTEFAVTVSKDLIAEFQQLAVALVARKVMSSSRVSHAETFERTAHVQLSTTNAPPSLFLDDDGYYLDLTYPNLEEGFMEAERLLTTCSTWNELTGTWSTLACRERPVLHDSLTVCRCRAKHMRQDGDTLTGTFAVRKAIDRLATLKMFDSLQNNFIEFAASNKYLIAFTAVELLLSSASLLSLILTAIFYKQWLKDVGHKILLHMVMALTMNLVLGFVTDYVRLDTEGACCIVVGVLRHYSFLAMFLWMLVMSGLQMKRLMTVAGAKATSHLVLKVAVFAWGVPWLPIVVLLAWNARIYRSDRYDRGFCYPEGVFFQVTVQGPAAFILFVNLLVFVAILRHIFECCSGEKITKHTKNERAQQMRRVATSVFIFFLFGFTWVLHYLSEERLIRSDFLFEYLFLMTATTHISVLALFFVVLDDNARAFWLEAVKGKVCFFR